MSGLALGGVLLSALLHATWNTAAKESGHPTAFLLAMEAASLVLFLPVLLFGFHPSEIPEVVWGLLVATGLAHALYGYSLSRGYAHGDLSLVYPIARSTPALVPLVAVPLLGESVSLQGALGIALVVSGMWAVQTDGRLEPRQLFSLGAAFAYLTLITTVGYSIFDKLAMERLAHASWTGRAPRALVYMCLMQAFYLPGFLALSLRSIAAREVWQVFRSARLRVAAAGSFGVSSYALILYTLQSSPVSYVTAVRQISVLFAVAMGVIWLRERPGPVRLAGAAANVAGVALIAASG
ncbi:MAG: EamA family transporter [Myxococcota bacterium]